MGLKWEFLPADGLETELFRAYVKSRPNDEAKRKMINDVKNSGGEGGLLLKWRTYRASKGENGGGIEGCHTTFPLILY